MEGSRTALTDGWTKVSCECAKDHTQTWAESDARDKTSPHGACTPVTGLPTDTSELVTAGGGHAFTEQRG